MKTGVLARLTQHSGLPSGMPDEVIEKDTLAEFVYQVTRGGPCPDLEIVTQDIIRCLDELNREMNQGADAERYANAVDRGLAYAVSGIVSACIETAIELRQRDAESHTARDLITAAWRVQCAWDGLLAGDEENLRELVAGEEWARFGTQEGIKGQE